MPGPGLPRAILGAALGIGLGIGLSMVLKTDAGQMLGIAYLFAFAGFLLGVGAFRFWFRWAAAKPVDVEDEHAAHGVAGDWKRYFRFTTDHKVIGVQYLVTAFILFFTAGTAAMFMRFELAQPGIATSKELYNTIMSTHGAMMITVALISIIGGLGNYLVPIMIGARDMAFPKANAMSYWMLPLAVLLVAINPLLGGFDSGWTAYPPLSQQANLGQQAYLMAFVTVGASSILSAINFLVTVFRMRAPGMSLMRMPIFVWALTVTAGLALIATSVVAAAFTMLLFDRLLGTSFFRATRGGEIAVRPACLVARPAHECDAHARRDIADLLVDGKTARLGRLTDVHPIVDCDRWMISLCRPEREYSDDAGNRGVRLNKQRNVCPEGMSGYDSRHRIRSQLVQRALDQCRHLVHQHGVAKKRGVGKAIQELFYIEADNRVALRGEALGESLMGLPKPDVVAEEEYARPGRPVTSVHGIEIERLALQRRVARLVRRARGSAGEDQQGEE